MSAETPEDFWYQNLAKYRNPPEPQQIFPSNVVVEQLTKIKKSEICVFEGYLKNGEELGAEGVQRIVKNLENITPKKLVDSIANELNWGAEKLRDDITCLALDLKNTELVKPIKKKREETEKKA